VGKKGPLVVFVVLQSKYIDAKGDIFMSMACEEIERDGSLGYLPPYRLGGLLILLDVVVMYLVEE